MKFYKAISCCISYILIYVSIAISADGPPAVRRLPTGPPAVPPAAPIKLLSQNDSVLAAVADCAAVNEKQRCFTRYFSLYNKPIHDRVKYIQTLNFLCNSISRARLIAHVYVVPGTDNSLLRVDITRYRFYNLTDDKFVGWANEVWDRLAKLDVRFTNDVIVTDQEIVTERVKKTKQVATGRNIYVPNGYGGYTLQPEYRTEYYYEQVPSTTKVASTKIRNPGPTIDPKAYATLREMTGSAYPIVSGDFFIVKASLPPFYHDFLGFGDTVDDFLAAVVLSKEDIKKAQLEINGVVVNSGAGFEGKVIKVTDNNRFITRAQGPYGYVWRTKDVANISDLTDYLRILNADKFDASEWIATGRNGLQWYFLSNNKDERQDEAPITIVRDNTNHDRRVRNGRSCITCHLRGINEHKPLPQELIKFHINIISPDYKANKILQDTFVGNFDEYFEKDNSIYSAAVKSATSVIVGNHKYFLDTETNARQFGELYNEYDVETVDIVDASYDCGVPVKDLMVIFDRAKNDPFLKSLSRNDPSIAIPRVHWERSFPQAMVLVAEAKGIKK